MKDIKRILEALREGVNPITGEIFDTSILSDNPVLSREILKLAISTQPELSFKKQNSQNLIGRDARTIFDELCSWRLEESRMQDIPAYCIFSNKELWAIAEGDVIDKPDLLLVKGVNKNKYDMYGEELYQLLLPFITENDEILLEKKLKNIDKEHNKPKELEYPHNFLCDVMGLSLSEYNTTAEQLPADIDARINSVLDGFPDKMGEMIRLRYADSEDFQDIGERFGISKKRVRQIVDRAISRTRAEKHMIFILGEIEEQRYLQSILELNPKTGQKRHKKPLPNLSEEQLEAYPYSFDSPVYVSDIVRALNSFRDRRLERAVQYKDISAWLAKTGYITETIDDNGKIQRDSTKKGNEAGIYSAIRTGADGTNYTVLLCRYGGQRLIVSHYSEIVSNTSSGDKVNKETDNITGGVIAKDLENTSEVSNVAEEIIFDSSYNIDERPKITCRNCILYRNETCFGKKSICEDFRNAIDIPQYEKDNWPDRMQGPYGTLHKNHR